MTEAVDVMLRIAVVVPLILLYLATYFDLYRRTDLSVVKKLLWAVFVFFTVYVGIAIYFMFRPPNTPEGKQYDATEHRTSAIVDSLEELQVKHEAGTIDAETYLDRKRELLGLTPEPTSTS
jgi:hypothetical protein